MKSSIIFSITFVVISSIIVSQFFHPENEISTYIENSVPYVGTEIPRTDGLDGSGVKVAVIDTGVDFNHPDLLGWGPDGKVIGGGLPVGAFASTNEIMNYLSPDGSVYQAGTLSGNPLAMSAGLATLNELKNNPGIYKSLENKTSYLEEGMKTILKNSSVDFRINKLGSMISLHFTSEDVIDFKSAQKGNNENFKKYFHGMLSEGVYLPPSAFESYFLNDALSSDDIDFTLNAFKKVIKSI